MILCWFTLMLGLVHSQDMTAYQETNNRFYIFDKGSITLTEFQSVSDLLVGNQFIAYANSRGDYSAVYNKQKITLTQGKTELIGTNNFLAYRISSVLRVFDRGKTTLLTSYVGSFGVGDSLVVFQDRVGGNLKYFYKGKIIEFAQVLGDYPIDPSTVGANVFVYKDNADNYKAFYNNEFYDLFRSADHSKFSAGLNLIAFNDYQNYTFSVFEKGNIVDVESQFANRFEAGNNFVYYQDNTGTNKVFSEGEVQELGYDLQEIQVYDSIVFFKEADYPKIWYNNEIHTLYNARFSEYQVSGGNLAFINQNGGVSAFIRGKVIDITRQKVQGFTLNGNTVVLKFTPSSYSVWWNGKLFNF